MDAPLEGVGDIDLGIGGPIRGLTPAIFAGWSPLYTPGNRADRDMGDPFGTGDPRADDGGDAAVAGDLRSTSEDTDDSGTSKLLLAGGGGGGGRG
jgi:hypothetical protein